MKKENPHTPEELKKIRSKRGKRSRSAGHSYERLIVNELKQIWPAKFGKCCTSRSESKRTDDKGIDICFTPGYQIQVKNCKNVQKYWNLLPGMPQADTEINVIIHKKTQKAGSKFISQGEYAIMTKKDFYKLLQRIMTARAMGALALDEQLIAQK